MLLKFLNNIVFVQKKNKNSDRFYIKMDGIFNTI